MYKLEREEVRFGDSKKRKWFTYGPFRLVMEYGYGWCMILQFNPNYKGNLGLFTFDRSGGYPNKFKIILCRDLPVRATEANIRKIFEEKLQEHSIDIFKGLFG